MKLILFDVDGTLMIGQGAGTRAMLRAGRALHGESFNLEGIMIGGGLDPVIFAGAMAQLGITPGDDHHSAFRDRYLQELALEFAAKKPILLPGVLELLSALEARSDVLIGLVTGNYRAAIPIKFGAVGLALERFRITAFGDCGPTRPDLVRIARERAHEHLGRAVEPLHTIIVGDTPRDVACALHHGCVCLGVGTGAHTLEELRSAGAQHVAADLRDANVLLSILV